MDFNVLVNRGLSIGPTQSIKNGRSANNTTISRHLNREAKSEVSLLGPSYRAGAAGDLLLSFVADAWRYGPEPFNEANMFPSVDMHSVTSFLFFSDKHRRRRSLVCKPMGFPLEQMLMRAAPDLSLRSFQMDKPSLVKGWILGFLDGPCLLFCDTLGPLTQHSHEPI